MRYIKTCDAVEDTMMPSVPIITGVGNKMSPRYVLCLMALLSAVPVAQAQQDALSVDRIFKQNEFNARGYAVNWMPKGGKYFVNRKAASGEGNDIVLIDPLGQQEDEILIPADKLIPEGESEPISISGFQVYQDNSKVLIFNNTRRVWRYHTRGDYWVADLKNGGVKKLGGPDAEPASLMFAKFSPDGNSVAYVRDRNVYVESLGQREDLSDHRNSQRIHHQWDFGLGLRRRT